MKTKDRGSEPAGFSVPCFVSGVNTDVALSDVKWQLTRAQPGCRQIEDSLQKQVYVVY